MSGQYVPAQTSLFLTPVSGRQVLLVMKRLMRGETTLTESWPAGEQGTAVVRLQPRRTHHTRASVLEVGRLKMSDILLVAHK